MEELMKIPGIPIDHYYYVNGVCNTQTKVGAYAYMPIHYGELQEPTAKKVENVTAPRIQLMAVIRAAKDAPSDKTSVIFSNDRYSVNAVRNGGKLNNDLIELFNKVVTNKSVYVVLKPNDSNDHLLHMVQDAARLELLGSTQRDTDRLTKKEYAFVMQLQDLLRRYNAVMNATSVESSDMCISIPKCNGRNVLMEVMRNRAESIELEQKTPF